MTKQVKKLAKNKSLFNITIKRLRNIYTSRQENLNEGNNALRRRNAIQQAYEEFMQIPAVLAQKEVNARRLAEHEERQRAYQLAKADQGGARTRRKLRK